MRGIDRLPLVASPQRSQRAAHCSVEVIRTPRAGVNNMCAECLPRQRGFVSWQKMKANVFHGKNDIRVEEVDRPSAGIGEAVIRVTLTTICGTDLHILRGEYPVKPGLIIGHEPVGVIEELGAGVTGYEIGDRVLVGAITPVRPMSSVPVWTTFAVWPRRGL